MAKTNEATKTTDEAFCVLGETVKQLNTLDAEDIERVIRALVEWFEIGNLHEIH